VGSAGASVFVWEGTGLLVLARVVGQDGEPVTPGTVASVTCQVWEEATGALVLALTPAPGDVILDALVAGDPRWAADGVGYNFRHALPAAAFPEGGRAYRAGYLLTPVAGEPFGFGLRVEARQLLSGAPWG
jgi:hypothetical protein